MPARIDSTTIAIRSGELKSLILSNVKSEVDATGDDNMTDLVEETVRDVLNTRYCATTDEIQNSFLLFV